jgi:hypothetical protein
MSSLPSLFTTSADSSIVIINLIMRFISFSRALFFCIIIIIIIINKLQIFHVNKE